MGGVLLCEKHGRDLNWKRVCEHIEYSDLLDMNLSGVKYFPNFKIHLCEECLVKIDVHAIEKYSLISFERIIDLLENDEEFHDYEKIENQIKSKVKTKALCSQCVENFR